MPGGLFTTTTCVVLEEDFQRDVLRPRTLAGQLGQADRDALAGLEAVGRLAAAAVDFHAAGHDDPPQMDAAVVGEAGGQEGVEPAARLGGVDGQLNRLGRKGHREYTLRFSESRLLVRTAASQWEEQFRIGTPLDCGRGVECCGFLPPRPQSRGVALRCRFSTVATASLVARLSSSSGRISRPPSFARPSIKWAWACSAGTGWRLFRLLRLGDQGVAEGVGGANIAQASSRTGGSCGTSKVGGEELGGGQSPRFVGEFSLGFILAKIGEHQLRFGFFEIGQPLFCGRGVGAVRPLGDDLAVELLGGIQLARRSL